MSVLHVKQVEGALRNLFGSLIDVGDVNQAPPDKDKTFLSRALASFAVLQLSGTTPVEAAASVTDGTNDNGIDAIYYDPNGKLLYVVQAKWHGDGNGSLSRADILKFTTGFDDLVNLRFERFNEKVKRREQSIRQALNDSQATFLLVLVHTGTSDLAAEPARDLQDSLDYYNDSENPEAIELLKARVLKQSEIHSLLARGTQGVPIDLEVALQNWGEASTPYAVYGQVAASDVARWWADHYPQIVSQNIRMFLGSDTEVNLGLQQTLFAEPEHFWHFNNGITVLCRQIRPKLLGGKSKETGFFTCTDVRIVNGAQTAGSIRAAFDKRPEQVEQAKVQVRFIAVADTEPVTLRDAITKATNTQNRINRQDFVALDPEQQRLRTELAIEGLTYSYKSSEATGRDPKTTDLEEATIALACSSSELSYSTLAKRELGRLWEDTSKAPYKALFNAHLTGSRLWRAVQLMRVIDLMIAKKVKSLSGRDEGFLVHGNRFLAHQIFQRLPADWLVSSSPLPADVNETIEASLDAVFVDLAARTEKLYPQAYLAQLFKNQTKLAAILGVGIL
ncbi:AIPR family protein [Bradyrhizobium diazoefficiens]|uniref:AIPR family protein n=1 Tax=Bradyrhizobium diazoefficiens TaxID=1355477 RepID=UPI003832E17B